MSTSDTKGLYGCECNRVACERSGATFFNPCTRAFYCATCARLINRWPENHRADGSPLCQYVEPADREAVYGLPSL